MTDERPAAAGAERATTRSPAARRAALAGLALLFVVFVGLGTWQVERRAWKLDLIARVEQRVHGAPVAPPDTDVGPDQLAADWEYRRVRLAGRFLPGADTFVQAVSELGAGFWVLTPLQRPGGEIVLVNRGFVAARAAAPVAATTQTVTGLLRLTEPGGGFLRRNDPAGERWFSRDVAAIAAARALGGVAPYFVDAEAARGVASADEPLGGLTVVRFPNSHLVYAVTWYVLAGLCVAGAVPLLREARRQRAGAVPGVGR